MPPIFGSTLLGAAESGFGTLLGSVSNAAASRRAYRHQLEFWNMQNEYNKPANVVKRLQEAGINPNSMMGQLSTGGSSQVGLPAPFTGSPSVPVHAPVQEVAQASLTGSMARYYDSAARLNNEKSDTETNQRSYLDALSENLKQSTLNLEQQNRILTVAANIQEATEANQVELSDQAIDKGAREIYLLWREQQRQDLVDSNLSASTRLLVCQSLEALIKSAYLESGRTLNEAQTSLVRAVLRARLVDAEVAEATKNERIAALKADYKETEVVSNSNVGHNGWRQWMESIGLGLGVVTDTIDAVLDVLTFARKGAASAAVRGGMKSHIDALAGDIAGDYGETWINQPVRVR